MTRLSALLRHPFKGWAAPDPHPQHSRPAACTYPTRAEVQDALASVLRPFPKTGLVSDHVLDRATTAVTSMWSAARDDLATGDLAYGLNDGTRGLAGPHDRDDAWLTFGRPPGEIGDVDSMPARRPIQCPGCREIGATFPHTNTGGTR